MIDPKMLYLGFLGLSVISIAIMYRMRLLSLPSAKDETGLALMSPLIGFLLFLGTCAYVPRWVDQILHYFDTHGISAFLQTELAVWSQLVTMVVALVLLVGFTCIHSQEIQSRIWAMKPGVKSACISLLKGVMYTVLTYPIVMSLVQLIHIGLESIGYQVSAEQSAVAHLKGLMSYPVLFWSMVVSVVTIVPVIEELLFRGLLQNFLQGVLGAKGAIFFASILFALFHYTSQQGASNVELMIGLFLYSVFMGIFYARTRSLWVSIGMHATFNALSVCLMMYVV